MPVQDQVVWQTINVNVGGQRRHFARGELLPAPVSEAEANARALMRLGGALRVVEVVYTEAELAARRRGRARPADAAERAGITAAAPASTATAAAPASGPVVLGPKPAAHGTKADWKAYAIAQGMPEAEADGMTRDQLIHEYRDRD
jgi:hypothetical protein